MPACSSNNSRFVEVAGGCLVWVRRVPLAECPGIGGAGPGAHMRLKRCEKGAPLNMKGGHDGRCWKEEKISIWLSDLLAMSPEHSNLAAVRVPDP